MQRAGKPSPPGDAAETEEPEFLEPKPDAGAAKVEAPSAEDEAADADKDAAPEADTDTAPENGGEEP